MGCEKCTFEEKYKDRFDEMKEDQKKLRDDQTEQKIYSGKIEVVIANFTKAMTDMGVKVDKLINRPNKRYEMIVGLVLAAVIGVAISKLIG